MRRTRRTGSGRYRPALGSFPTWPVLVALLSPVAAHGQVSPEVVSRAIANACERAPDPASEAVVAGVVIDSISGVALPRVQMTLTWRATADTAATSQVATTGSGGLFVFCHVPAGVSAKLVARERLTRGPFTWEIEPGQLYVQNILLPLSTMGRKGILVGQVIDAETRRPVVDAVVRLAERGRPTDTNSHGFFTLGEQPFGIYTLEVKRLGYADYSAPVRVAGDLQQSVEVPISRQALQVEGLTVTVRATRQQIDMDGLVRRMDLGIGSFITADELDKRPMARITDLLRGMAGLWVDVNQRDHTFSLEVRGHPCTPDVFVDGVRYSGSPDELDVPPAEDLEAVEVYKGRDEIPGIFMRATVGRAQCAVVAVWRRASPRSGGGG